MGCGSPDIDSVYIFFTANITPEFPLGGREEVGREEGREVGREGQR